MIITSTAMNKNLSDTRPPIPYGIDPYYLTELYLGLDIYSYVMKNKYNLFAGLELL